MTSLSSEVWPQDSLVERLATQGKFSVFIFMNINKTSSEQASVPFYPSSVRSAASPGRYIILPGSAENIRIF